MQKNEIYRYIYDWLLAVFPQKPWRKAINNLKGNGKTTSINKLGDRIFSLGLCKWEDSTKINLNAYDQAIIADAMMYSNFFLGLYNKLPERDRANAQKRFEAAFTQPNDMRAIQFELFTLNYLQLNKYEVDCKDNYVTGDTFDFLIHRSNGPEIEIECKSFAYDKGLYITADEASRLCSSILNQKEDSARKIDKRITVITIEMLKALPKSTDERKLLEREILKEINGETTELNKGIKVHKENFDDVKDIDQIDAHLALKIKMHGVELAKIIENPKGNAERFCLRVTTHLKDGFWRDFEKKLRNAAKKQLSGKKPSSIAVHIYNIDTLEYFLKDTRFTRKIDNIFNQKHLISLIIIANINAHMDDNYPYFHANPFVKEFQNSKSKFENMKILN